MVTAVIRQTLLARTLAHALVCSDSGGLNSRLDTEETDIVDRERKESFARHRAKSNVHAVEGKLQSRVSAARCSPQRS